MRRKGFFSAGISIVVLACMWWAPAAQALGLTDLSAEPDDITAGAHSDFAVHIGIQQPADQIKDLTVHLPPGLVGDPTATPLCTAAQLNSDSCPAASQVGETSSDVLLLGLVPLTVPGSIYNLEAQPGEPARFGIVLRPPLSSLGALPKIMLQSPARLRQSDFGLDTVINDIPNQAAGTRIDITALDMRLFGSAGGPPKPFMRNPTSCQTAIIGFDATSYAHPNQTASGDASFTPTNCASLPFSPTLTAKLGAAGLTDPGDFTPLTTVIEQDVGEAGLRRAEVQLPAAGRVLINLNALLQACSSADFNAGTCPPDTVLGSAEASSPLLTEPLSGPLVALDEDGVLQLGLDLQGPLSLRLRGTPTITEELRATNIFDGLPDIPISRFALTVAGRERGLLRVGSDLCEPPAPSLRGIFDAHSGAHQQQDVAATIDAPCDPHGSRNLTLRYSRAAQVFKGALSSTVPECQQQQVVRIWRQQNGPDEKLGQRRTSDTGAYRLPFAAGPGNYYSTAAENIAAGGVCERARSRTLNLP